MKKTILVALFAAIAASAHARDLKGEFIQWCGKTTIGDFAATNAANGGSDAPAGSVYFTPVGGLTFAGKPIQEILIKEGSGSAPDVYGVTLSGSSQSATALLASARNAKVKVKVKPSTFHAGTVDIYCAATQAESGD